MTHMEGTLDHPKRWHWKAQEARAGRSELVDLVQHSGD